MSDATFAVLHAGPLVTIQDYGRSGFARFGVPRSGPMDRLSFDITNLALGSQRRSTVIEVSAGGLTLECKTGEASFAVFGGEFNVTVGTQKFASRRVSRIEAGQKLIIQPGKSGNWTYLAIAGQLKSAEWLGSAATHSMSGFGGGAITTGAKLEVRNAEIRDSREGEIPLLREDRPDGEVDIVLGPQDRFFGADSLENLKTGTFNLTNAFDRMGVRLKGPALVPSAKLDMPSEPIVRGSIQVAGDGVATVLLSDHQTAGGYPKIATVVSDDVDRLAQLRPGNTLSFNVVSPEDAIKRVRARHNARVTYMESAAKGHGSLLYRLLNENLISGVVADTDD